MGASITVTCEGYAYVGDFETEDLIKELKRRQQPVTERRDREELHDVREAILARRYDDALIYIERILWPKWKSEKAAADALAKLREHH